MMLEYAIEADYIAFSCLGVDIDENKKAADILSDFLLKLSEDQKVFIHAYRLPGEDVPKLMGPEVILEKAGTILEPFHTYFHLKEAKIDLHYFEYACELFLYYFDKQVEWPDFLAASEIDRPIKFIKKGVLQAMFTCAGQGTDFWFECSKTYEKKVMQLLVGMSNAGFEIKQYFKLPFR